MGYLNGTRTHSPSRETRTTYFTMEEKRPKPFGRSLLIIQASTTI